MKIDRAHYPITNSRDQCQRDRVHALFPAPEDSCSSSGVAPVVAAEGASYRPATIGAIKRCFTNGTGEQHGIQARPIHRHGRPDVDPSHGLTSCGMIGADVGRIGDRTSTSGGWVRQK